MGQCVPCGGQGQPCCFDAPSRSNINCDPPFKPSGFMMCTCQ
jgi:hypothetical protein